MSHVDNHLTLADDTAAVATAAAPATPSRFRMVIAGLEAGQTRKAAIYAAGVSNRLFQSWLRAAKTGNEAYTPLRDVLDRIAQGQIKRARKASAFADQDGRAGVNENDNGVSWTELQAAAREAPPHAPRPMGTAGHLSEQEKNAIRYAYLESGGTLTFKELGTRFNVNRDSVSACCKGPEFLALSKALEAEVRQTAVTKLKALTMPAVEAFGTAIPIAAKKGDVRPAERLLKHVGIMEDAESGTGLLVLTTINVNGAPSYRGNDGNIYEQDPATGLALNLPKGSTAVHVGGYLKIIETLTDRPPVQADAVDGEVLN